MTLIRRTTGGLIYPIAAAILPYRTRHLSCDSAISSLEKAGLIFELLTRFEISCSGKISLTERWRSDPADRYRLQGALALGR